MRACGHDRDLAGVVIEDAPQHRRMARRVDGDRPPGHVGEGQELQPTGGADPPLRDAPTIAAAIVACEETWRAIDAVIEQHSLDELCKRTVHGDSQPLNLRWVVAHLLEETARHAGHADILRELIDGSTGR